MADVTLIEVHIEEGSITTNLPFSGISSDDETDKESEEEATAANDEESSNKGKGLALLGVLVFLVIGTALVKYLTGDDESDVAIETDETEPPAVSAE